MTAQPASADAVRQGADSVYRYIERTAEAGPEGVRWRTSRDPDGPRYTPQLYGGVAGITVFLSDYFRLTGVTAARELARRALEWCGAPGHPPRTEHPAVSGRGVGGGWAGIGLAWLRLAQATGDAALLGKATDAAAEVLRAEPGPHPQTDLGFGAAGTGVFLLRLWEATHDDRYLAGAVRLGEWLDRVAVRDQYGCHWPRGHGNPQQRRGRLWHWTGFETGAAGIGYFLLALAQATRQSRWADVAREVEATLAGQARRDGEAVSWPPTLATFGEGGAEFNEQVPGRRWQWCTGASGIGLFYARAAEVLGEAAFLETATAAGEGTWTHGDVRRNPSQCHGLAGCADLFLVLHRLTQEPVWRARALDFGRQALAYRAATAEGDAWPADDPEQPGLYSPDFGWGGAGVGHFFLRVLAPDRVSMPLG